ncbi:prolyl-tRNA editing protein [Phyllobacterium phragmitis]|uniref:Prolyl-tRNA editing protein n=1 Tax=Phyllobacterium phragmitis TaxID=2670329 RepID=A0A2S9IXV8_9HYPH|nr:YbaK/EbsC family protein [Phyllobacterium phragmitis]PRD45359.1 prolyl-tRNA editing protein [Phyllobacterium phragmitis]
MDMVEKVRQALLAFGHEDSIAEFPAGTHSAADAAAAVGCSVAQIAKSIVFRAGDNVILVIASGAHHIDRNKVSSVIGQPVKSADAAWVQSKTGFAIGGVAPVGHDCQVTTIIDSELLSLDPLWAAAGSPVHAFRTTAEQLIQLTNGGVAEVRQA